MHPTSEGLGEAPIATKIKSSSSNDSSDPSDPSSPNNEKGFRPPRSPPDEKRFRPPRPPPNYNYPSNPSPPAETRFRPPRPTPNYNDPSNPGNPSKPFIRSNLFSNTSGVVIIIIFIPRRTTKDHRISSLRLERPGSPRKKVE